MARRIKGLTIKIGADTKELTDAIKGAEKQIYSASEKLRDVNKLLKFDPKNTELLTQKQKYLNDAINGTEEKLKQEREALKQLKEAPQTEEIIRKQEALEREIVETTGKLEGLKKEYKDFGSVAVQQTKQAAEQMKAAGSKIQEAGGKISGVGKTLTTHVTAPLMAAGAYVVKTAADFDAGMSKVQAISGATADEMGRLEEKAEEMASSTKFTLNDTADAYSYMAMAGWKAEQMLDGLPGIMYLAAASQEDLATTSDIVTDALTAFNLTAEDSGRFADVLAAASSNSNTNVKMLGESFKYAAAPAGTLGYTIEDVALALGLMANNGIKADMAGTSLRNIFNRMAKPTKESQAAIDQLGLSLYDNEGKMYSFREVMMQMRSGFSNVKMPAADFDKELDELDKELADGTLTQKKYDAAVEDLTRRAFGAEQAEKARAAAMLGGTRAMSGLLAIVNTSDDDFEKLATTIDGSSEKFARLEDGSVVPLSEALANGQKVIEEYNGSAEAMAATMEDNLNGEITRLKSQIEVLAKNLGEILIPQISKLVDWLQKGVQAISDMDEADKRTLLGIAEFAAAVGPVLIVIGSIVSAIGKVVWAIGSIKTALAGTAAATAATEGAAAGATGAVAGLGSAIGGLLLPITLVIAAITTWIIEWENIKEAARLFVERTIEHLQELRDFLAPIIEGIKIGFKLAWEYVAGIVKSKIDFIKAVVSGGLGFNDVKEKIQSLPEAVRTTFDNIKKFMEGFVLGFKTFGSDLVNNFKEGISSRINSVKESVNKVGKAVKERLHFSEPDVGPLADFNSWMPDMMNQMAQQIAAGIPGVAGAVQNVASTMAEGFQTVDYSQQLNGINQSVQGLATAGAGGDIVVPVYIGNTKMGQAVASANMINTYRSGGR